MLCIGCRPSEIMGIEDPYTAFCFDEACSYIVQKITDGEEPIIKEHEKKSNNQSKHLKPSEIFSKYNNVNVYNKE